MAKALSLAELRELSDERLIELHDQEAGRNVEANVNYYLAELARRDLDRQTRTMVTLTKVITVATIANVVLTGVAAYAAFG